MNPNNEYSLEELMPVVIRLSKRYTGFESTSVSYDTLQMLMEAVLYCIREPGVSGGALRPGRTAQEAYDTGFRLVVKKTEDALKLYNRIAKGMDDYGMECLRDTMQKGMPEFFRRYDPLYHPQDTLLLLDYPVPGFDRALTGVDAIYNYLGCMEREQKYLQQYPRELVIKRLREYHCRYDLLFESVSEIYRSYSSTL